MNNIELNKVAIRSIGIDTIRLPGVGSASAKASGSLFHKSLVDAWFMSGYSNDNPPASISGYKGHELVLKNFAFAGSSGFGKYSVNKKTWANTNRCERIDVDYLTYTFVNITESSGSVLQYIDGAQFSVVGNIVKVRVAGIPEGGKVDIGNYITNITEDGVYEGTYTRNTNNTTTISTTNCIGATITVEFLPDNAGSLVFDGVDDYAICEGLLPLDDFTVICRRTFTKESISSKRNAGNNTGAFVADGIFSSGKNVRSYGTNNIVSFDTTDSITYMTPTNYNGKTITRGTWKDSDFLLLGGAYRNNEKQVFGFMEGAIYYFALYDKSLTPDEIEQEKIKLNEIWTKRLNG